MNVVATLQRKAAASAVEGHRVGSAVEAPAVEQIVGFGSAGGDRGVVGVLPPSRASFPAWSVVVLTSRLDDRSVDPFSSRRTRVRSVRVGSPRSLSCTRRVPAVTCATRIPAFLGIVLRWYEAQRAPVARTGVGYWPLSPSRRHPKTLHKRIKRYQLGTRPVPHGYQSGTESGLFARGHYDS